MNLELAKIIKIYATGSHKQLNNELLDISKDTLISVFNDLLTMYINDKNSSTIREFITVSIAGYKHHESKIGYNGYKQNSIVGGKPIMCEAKPKNTDTNSKKIRKLNGGGNFTDYTFERLERDKKENPNMLISGFVDGKLIYILEFPFDYPEFNKHLEEQLKNRFKEGKDKTGQYLRGANFHYKHFINYKKLKIVFLLNKEQLKNCKQYLVENFYKFLEENSNGTKQAK